MKGKVEDRGREGKREVRGKGRKERERETGLHLVADHPRN